MDEILANPSNRRALRLMINQQADIRFILLENDLTATTTGWTWRLCLKRYPGDRQSIFCLTLNNELRYEVYSDVVLLAHMTSAQLNIEEGEYYWKLEMTDIEKTVIDGVAYVTFDTRE